jgi:5-methyltetrahydropteroyltriglutamate--homocysteine methyltransferase
MLVTPTGRFPIVRDGAHPMRAALEARRARGEVTPEAARQDETLLVTQQETGRELLAAQEAAGVDLPTDGYIPIYDEWFAWAPSVAGVTTGGHIRYLDTNTYYHRWQLSEPPRRIGDGPAVASYRHAATLSRKDVKPCLFGPYTLWAYAVKEGAGATRTAFDALVEVVAGEVAALAAAGARYVQIDESVVLRPKHRGDVPLVAGAVERIAAAAPGLTLIVHLACGAVGDLLPAFLDISGLGGLGLDFTDVYRDPNLAALAAWHGDTLLQAGVMDARHVRLEAIAEIHQTLAAVTAFVPPRNCVATPSTGLQHLPYHIAFDKLANLVSAAHSFTPLEVGA